MFIRPKSNHCRVTESLSQSRFEFCSYRWICQSCYMYFSRLLHGFVKVDMLISISCWMDFSKLIIWSGYMDLIKLLNGYVKVFYVFLALCQTKPSWSLTKISKLDEASALNWWCWMSQSTQCLGFVLPMAMYYISLLCMYYMLCSCASCMIF